jgi:hypothetical protein
MPKRVLAQRRNCGDRYSLSRVYVNTMSAYRRGPIAQMRIHGKRIHGIRGGHFANEKRAMT